MELWEGYHEAAQSTEQLMAALNDPSFGNRKKKKSNESKRKNQKKKKSTRLGETITPKEKPRRKKAPSETPGYNTGGRETFEVLDGSTPRVPESNPTFDQHSSEPTDKREATAKQLDFKDEKSRVETGGDTFVPQVGARLQWLDDERQRLEDIQKLHQGEEMKQAMIQADILERKTWAEQDTSALQIQRLFRGRLSRRRVDVINERRAWEKQTKKDWVEVRDGDDVWYYNRSTGESVWEKPVAPGDTIMPVKHVGDRASTLPAVVQSKAEDGILRSRSEGNLRRDSRLKNDADRPQSSESKLPPLKSTNVNLYDDEHDDIEFSDGSDSEDSEEGELTTAVKGIMAMDLRSAVRNAKTVSKFDSVATLMMGNSGTQAKSKGTQRKKRQQEEPLLERKPLSTNPNSQSMVSVLKFNQPTSSAKKGSTAAVTQVKDIKSLTIRDVKHPGFDVDLQLKPEEQQQTSGEEVKAPTDEVVHRVSEICFNCWSAGKGKYCALHLTEERAGSMPNSGSALMCKNWNLGVLQKRYRSEEIQEVFMKSASSLRFDKARKRFVTVEEFKHPIYRNLSHLLSKFNFTFRRKIHQQVWLKSLIETLRTGKIQRDGASHSAGMLRLRNTIFNTKWVKQYASSVTHLHPKGPVTGTTLAERRGEVECLVVIGEESIIRVDRRDVPIPLQLYEPRKYDLPAPRAIPMPRPSYKRGNGVVRKEPGLAHPSDGAPNAGNRFIDESAPAAWLERFVRRCANDAIYESSNQVEALSPIPGVELLRRTKYPSPQTIKFASLARKPVPGNMAVGGLAAELTVQELVQTVIPPQFGDYTVMHKTSTAPNVSAEITAWFEPSPDDPTNQQMVSRPLQHALNTRRAPCIMIATSANPEERFWYGSNRPEQTGEDESHGFRTSAFASECDLILVTRTHVTAFEPSGEVATPNLPAANQTVTTHVDHTYPFCEPSNRNNTTLDFYHLLLFGTCAPNKEQIFTNFGTQECGDFMKETDITKPMGHALSHVYRSWAFVQRQLIEEFLTDDGLPYWYDRRTGETFWERPLAEIEQRPVIEGGTQLSSEASDGEPRLEDTQKKYRQDDVRKLILRKHESPDDMLDRRRHAAQSVKWARDEGKLPSIPGGALQSLEQQSTAPQSMASRPVESPHRLPSRQPEPFRAVDELAPIDTNPSVESQESEFTSIVSHPAPPASGNPMVQTLTQALTEILPQLSNGQVNGQDLLQLGMGIGMSLNAQGVVNQSILSSVAESSSVDQQSTFTDHDHQSVTNVSTSSSSQGTAQPIGQVDPTVSGRSAHQLNHSLEVSQHDQFLQASQALSTHEQYQGIAVVKETPDEEVDGIVEHWSKEDEARKQVPVFAYPKELLGKDYMTHPVAGEGTSFVREGSTSDQAFVEGSKRILRRSGDVLPEGFFQSITATHMGKSEVDYLPTVPNLPQPRPVGRVKPRSAAEDWFAIKFDPWSAGKDPLSCEFVASLTTKEEGLLEQSRKRADDAFIEVLDQEGRRRMEAEASAAQKIAEQFAEMSSWVRHGKYRELETAMNQPDFNVPIDFQDDLGNTLLHIAAQNGNKRIAKLCLRRGGTINKQNNAGQTVLHYAHSYGFMELFQYLMSKGADDALSGMLKGSPVTRGLDNE